ncbi:sulfurtransferase TusA family protein [Marinicella sp. S1101]|uniref:sulfurtransferase TusA family protein n=1 Tax=Marinicella marina TaxID=2996016 RepID=UPI002260A121|nr:sulfurtransferase TusA family protein [Marinicella marina]MCX7554236.1 sulfurtransferase TusA family protein [Marinicella marina]MDJ1138771.1 sulfurtransferase TusA family protein [Marinicella marina]
MSDENTTHIDATGLNCPVPLMLLKKAVSELPADAAVIIEVTDVHAELDFEIWCERFGHQLELLETAAEKMRFKVTVR